MFRKFEEFNRCIEDQGGSSCNSILESKPIERAEEKSEPFKSPCVDAEKTYNKCKKRNSLTYGIFCKYELESYARCVKAYTQAREELRTGRKVA